MFLLKYNIALFKKKILGPVIGKMGALSWLDPINL